MHKLTKMLKIILIVNYNFKLFVHNINVYYKLDG